MTTDGSGAPGNRRYRAPVLSRGGGTSLSGETVNNAAHRAARIGIPAAAAVATAALVTVWLARR
ncbi:MAG: hypothetical protein JO100_02880 [Pseudonocardia sp.]|nr:hypothetical protein [Pseudonocardia sp.]